MAEISKVIPPYLPYKTLVSSFENFSHGIPPKIDRSIWKNQPGTVQSQILSAYKFLGLMDEQTAPTQALKTVVQNRNTPEQLLKEILEEKYSPILKHGLATMTTTMLASEFETAFGVDGETKKKGIRFFLQAAKANGLTLSKFLLDQTRVSSASRKKRTPRQSDAIGNMASEFEQEDEVPSAGTAKHVNLASGGQLRLNLSVDLFGLSAEDRAFVFGLIDSLKAYEDKVKSETFGGSEG